MDTLSLPAITVTEAEVTDQPLGLDGVNVGDTVAIYGRGRMRVAVVEKVGRKNVGVVFTTPTAVTEAREGAMKSRVPGCHAEARHQRAQADRYVRMAELIEAHGIEVTAGRSYPDSPFRPLAGLPAEYVKLDTVSGSNAARTTIVYSPDQLREWAANALQSAERAETVKLAEAEAWDALPYEEKVRRLTTVTRKSVSADKVYGLREGVIA